MRLRVAFEYSAGVCLWADDPEAFERWTSAVSDDDAGLPEALAQRASALRERFDAWFDPNDPGGAPVVTAEEQERFFIEAEAWSCEVREVLAARAIEVVTCEEVRRREQSVENGVAGRVVAVFSSAEHARNAARGLSPDLIREGTLQWYAGNLAWPNEAAFRRGEWWSRLEGLAGLRAAWWCEAEGQTDHVLAGDPEDHALTCLRQSNLIGWANFLHHLQVQQVWLGEDLVDGTWSPERRHRLADGRGSWWEWWTFLRAATALLKVRSAGARYLRAEKERLWCRWDRGGSRGGWPATWAEGVERLGLRRTSFRLWRQTS